MRLNVQDQGITINESSVFQWFAFFGIEICFRSEIILAMEDKIEGQLSPEERALLVAAVCEVAVKPKVVLEVGTWLGGGSTLHILEALERNGEGRLWGIEADQSIYERMLQNLSRAAPVAMRRFTPLFGSSKIVIPRWLREQGAGCQIDLAFLDGGNRPGEQITEFNLIDPHIPVGGILMAHDAKVRKGKWLVPFVSRLDNWESKVHDSEVGLFYARKTALQPSASSLWSARRALLRMRLNPVEIAAAVVPSRICGLVLGLLPDSLSRRLSEGRN
jgi:predicted O-methyltransferase YrrM